MARVICVRPRRTRHYAASPQPLPQMSLLARRSGPSAPPTAAGSGYSLLDAQLVITGDLDTAGSLRIDGKLEGNVRRADTVVLGVGATMTGDVHAREVVIGGSITGNIHATDRVELQATAIVTGDVLTQTILVQEGGVVNGRVLMRPPEDSRSDSTLLVNDGSSSSR
jgi:cytoskeletal protein CcmA (bactofilin family)